MNQKVPAALIAALLASWAPPSAADSMQARCEIYAKGSDKMEKMVPCTFGQRQGHITITRDDGEVYEAPLGACRTFDRKPKSGEILATFGSSTRIRRHSHNLKASVFAYDRGSKPSPTDS